jgi:hypothetical protein
MNKYVVFDLLREDEDNLTETVFNLVKTGIKKDNILAFTECTEEICVVGLDNPEITTLLITDNGESKEAHVIGSFDEVLDKLS